MLMPLLAVAFFAFRSREVFLRPISPPHWPVLSAIYVGAVSSDDNVDRWWVCIELCFEWLER